MKRFLFVLALLIAGGANVSSAQEAAGRSESIVTIAGESFYVHTVKPQETIFGLGELYNVSKDDIKKNNPQAALGLQAGQVIKIPVRGEVNKKGEEVQLTPRQQRRTFVTHTVNRGETGYSIAKRYGISINTLIEDNRGFDPSHLSIGQVLNIRRDSQGKTSGEEIDEQLNDYAVALNTVSDGFEHHPVAEGETLYSLSRQYNVSIETLQQYNMRELENGLKMGSIIRIPVPKKEAEPQPKSIGQQSLSGDMQTDRPDVRYEEYRIPRDGDNLTVKNIDIQLPLKVVVILPLRVNGANDVRYIEFYQGVLMALDELKGVGVSARVDLYNSGRSEAEVRAILQTREVQEADLIIGPVYDEEFTVVADFARDKGIPVVSPLAAITHADNSLLFQAAAAEEFRYDKLRGELAGDKNIIIVTGNNDANFEKAVDTLVANPSHRITYNRNNFSSQAESVLDKNRENIFVVLPRDGNAVDDILARISSMHNNMVARSMGNPQIKVVGTSAWTNFSGMDKNLLFKLNVMYVASYYADRSNGKVAAFDKKYVASFSSLPSLYSYRGYDVAKLFVCNMKLHGSRFADYINDGSVMLLQSPYDFEQMRRGGKYVNTRWVLVQYRSDYTIEVK